MSPCENFISFENFNCLQFEPHFDINKNIPNRQHIQKKIKTNEKKNQILYPVIQS